MPLNAYAVNAYALLLQHLHYMLNTVNLGLTPHVIVIIVKLCIRVATLSRTESETYQFVPVLIVFLPALVITIAAFLACNLVYYIPGIDLTSKMRDGLLYILYKVSLHLFLRTHGSVFL